MTFYKHWQKDQLVCFQKVFNEKEEVDNIFTYESQTHGFS